MSRDELRRQRRTERARELYAQHGRRRRQLTDHDIEHCAGCGSWIIRGAVCLTCAALHHRLEATR